LNIKVIREEMRVENTAGTGGEYADTTLEIYLDNSLPLRSQREVIIHAVIENYNRGMTHDKVDQLTDFIQQGLDQLEGGE